MTTAIQGTYVPFTCTNLTQTLNYSEGVASIPTLPLILTTSLNYSRVYTLTMTLSSFSQVSSVSLTSSQLNGIPFTRVGNVYTISSEYVDAQGVKINNWAYFKLAIQYISIVASHSDLSDSFSIATSLTDGATTLTGNIQVYTVSVPDVTGNNQSVTVGMAMNGQSLTTVGGTNIAINDPAQAGKTYRVTVTPVNATNASGTSDMTISRSGVWTTPYVVTGTQAYINGQLASSGNGNGLNFNQYNMNFYGTTTVSYLQEVLTTTEPGVTVPYVQETGTLTFNTTYTAPFVIGSNPTYVEDGSVTFSLGSITDPAGTNYAHETCGVYQGYNCYTVTATVAGSFSGSNPVVLTYAGDVSLNNSITFTGSKTACNSFLSSVTLIPPADYVDPLTINITVTRGNTPVTIYTGSMTATCTSTHSEFSIISGAVFAIGNNTINFGSITDAATAKNYTVVLHGMQSSANYGTLTDLSGTGVWVNTGGGLGFGKLTISGTKSVINASLAAIRYTTGTLSALSDNVGFVYEQDQTTNVFNQGQTTVMLNNAVVWGAGNGVHSGQNAFVYDQDVTTTWNLATLGGNIDTVTTYTAKLVFSTPLSVANLGSVTGWTRETDYIWTLSGVRATLNAALAAVVLVPPAQLVSNFSLDIKVYNGATLVSDTSAVGITKTIYINQLVGGAWGPSSLIYGQDFPATWGNLFTLNSNFGSGTYTLRLKTSIATGGTITGWTTVDSTTFEKTDTKANLQTALNSVVFTPPLTFVSNFTLNLEAYRNSLLLYTSATLSNSNPVLNIMVYHFIVTSTPLYFNQDETTVWDFGEFSTNFDYAKTYTVRLVTNITTATAGAFTGWTVINSTTVEKTDTGANLTTALNNLTFVSNNVFASNFSITLSYYRSGTLLYTAPSKTILFGGIISFMPTSTNMVFSQDVTTVYAPFGTLSANINQLDTYTLRLAAGLDLGEFTGWTKITTVNEVYYEKTGTGANLVTAVSSLEFIPRPDLIGNAGCTIQVYKNSLLVSTSAYFYLYCNNQYTITAGANTTPTFNQNSSNNLNNLFTFSSLWNNSKTYTFVLETKNESGALIDVGTITGWTMTSTGVYSKTDLSSALIVAANAIVFVSNYSNANAFRLQLKTFSGAIGLVQYPATYFTVAPGSTYSISTVYASAIYGTTFNNINMTTLSSLYSNAETYTLRLSVATSAVIAPNAGWTVVDPYTISVTGNKAALQNALNAGLTITPNSYVNSNINAQITVTLAGNTINSTNFYFTLAGSPTIKIGQKYSRNFFFINNITDIDGVATTTITTSETYAVKITANNGVLISDLSAPGLIFTISGDHTYGVSNYVTMPVLVTGVNSLSLTTQGSETLNTNNTTVTLSSQILGQAPFVPSASNSITLYNGATVGMINEGLAFYGTTAAAPTLVRGATTTVSLGTTNIARNYKSGTFFGNISYYNDSETYTATITGTPVTAKFVINGWTNPSTGTYQISGNKTFIDTQLSALSVTSTGTNNNTMYFDLTIATAGTTVLKQHISFGVIS